MKKEIFQAGLNLLKQPVLPLVSMVQFMYQLSDPGTEIETIINEMPEPLETGYTVYHQPRKLLRQYLSQLKQLERASDEQAMKVQDETGQPVDVITASTAFINQRILEEELEAINSLLCAPCNCTLCCMGPDQSMEQEFFEIPFQTDEIELFSLSKNDTPASRTSSAMAAPSLQVEDKPFYQCDSPKLFHWHNGWSMILPKKSSCPGLGEKGRCLVYPKRPQVCRRPQIFSYILEQSKESAQYILRNTLLAVTDCPYVQLLQEDIAAYAAASELELIFKRNKG
ncbi:MAG: hypothetical protein D3923_10325 [Candidatus Electrothrix sp. AR3]|nr:hypothetical protein [Candidatus Electrothrix sp. AR3]